VFRARAERTESAIVLDGRLDEPAWSRAPAINDFRQIEPVQGADPFLATEARVLFDAQFLYIGMEVHDPEGAAGVRAPDLRRDFVYAENDLVGISLDGFGDGRSAIAFQVNPRGALRDVRAFDGQYYDVEWQGVWDVRSRIHEEGWTAEIRIPWSTLRYDPDAAAWRMILVRRSRRLNEEAGWPEWPRQNNPYSMRFAGLLEGLSPPPPARNVHFQPYVVTRSEGDPTVRALGEERTIAVGGEMKWTVAPTTVVDLTVNTDFAEADVDQEVLDLTRFSVFLPEQRPFFLENAGLFLAGGSAAQRLEPFFTRRIGLDSSGRTIPLDGGVRITHQSPTQSGGVIFIRQRATDTSPATHFAVARAQKNIRSEDRIGALGVSRFDESGARNHVGAVDLFVRPVAPTFLRGMISASSTTGDGGDGWSAYAHLSNSFSWGYLGWVQVLVSPDYRADVGFVPRTDLITTSPAASFDLRPAWLPSFVRSWQPGVTTMFFHRLSDTAFQEGSVTLRPLNFAFHDGSQASLWGRMEMQRLQTSFRPITDLEIAPGEYDYPTIGITRQPDLSRRYWAYVTVTTGAFYDGHREQIIYRASPLPGPRLSLTFDYSGNRFRNVGVGEERDVMTHLAGLRVRAALNPRLQFSTVYQYNSSARRASLNARFSWEFAPLSFLHVVLNDGRPAGLSADDPGSPATPRSRQLLIKGSYLWTP